MIFANSLDPDQDWQSDILVEFFEKVNFLKKSADNRKIAQHADLTLLEIN